jgi:hypothetical protein
VQENLATESTRTKRVRKPKKSQIPYALGVSIFLILLGSPLVMQGSKLPIYWAFGIAFGYILQRSRFCFTASFRDPCITGSTSVTRAVLVALGIATIGYTAIKYHSTLNAAGNNLAMSGVAPIGIPLMLGAIIFGIGMVIAGGCASGTLMRVGEGFTMQMLSLVFFVVGSLWGAHDMNFWGKLNQDAPKIFLPNVFGWFGALAIQGLIILLLYIAAVKWQQKKMGSAE